MSKITEPLFLAHPGIYIHILNSGMVADQLVMRMQHDIASLENSLTVIKVNHILTIQTHNPATRYLATGCEILCFYCLKNPTF